MAPEPISVLSGKDGSVWIGGQRVALVLWWELVRHASSKAYVSNDTAGWRRQLAGAKEATGRLELKLQADGFVPVEVGQEVSIRLHLDDSGENYYEVPALIARIRNRVDIASGEVIGWVVDFVGTGPVVGHGILEPPSSG